MGRSYRSRIVKMLSLFTAIVSLASAAVAQQTSYEPGTGVRSLWFPYVTLSGTPVASILGHATGTDNITSYVVSCPTATPECTISPNMTLTEGPSTARYLSSNDAGTATIRCDITSFTTGECHQEYLQNGQIVRTSRSVGTDVITYQPVQLLHQFCRCSDCQWTVGYGWRCWHGPCCFGRFVEQQTLLFPECTGLHSDASLLCTRCLNFKACTFDIYL